MRISFFIAFAAALVLCGTTASHAGVIFGGPAINLDGDPWSVDGSVLAPWRAALENPSNFGSGGTVGTEIDVVSLSVINPTTLAGIDVFVVPYWSDGVQTTYAPILRDYFLGGGSLWLLNDSTGHDALGALLGVPTAGHQVANPHTGAGNPLFEGPFGTIASINQSGTQGYLNDSDIAAANGTVASRNSSNRPTSAFWAPGQFAPGAGAMVIMGDVDMVSSTANYSTLNNNAIYALNSAAFFVESVSAGPLVPEPSSMILWAGALALCGVHRRRRGA